MRTISRTGTVSGNVMTLQSSSRVLVLTKNQQSIVATK